MLALITFLTYPVSTCTAEHEDAANSFTKGHNRRGSELSCNSAHTQACTVKPVLSGHPLLSGQ